MEDVRIRFQRRAWPLVGDVLVKRPWRALDLDSSAVNRKIYLKVLGAVLGSGCVFLQS